MINRWKQNLKLKRKAVPHFFIETKSDLFDHLDFPTEQVEKLRKDIEKEKAIVKGIYTTAAVDYGSFHAPVADAVMSVLCYNE